MSVGRDDISVSNHGDFMLVFDDAAFFDSFASPGEIYLGLESLDGVGVEDGEVCSVLDGEDQRASVGEHSEEGFAGLDIVCGENFIDVVTVQCFSREEWHACPHDLYWLLAVMEQAGPVYVLAYVFRIHRRNP